MNGLTNVAKIFIVSLGILFILLGLVFSLLFNAPTVLTVGMGVVGIFLIFLPYTRDRYEKV